ncbi:MBL fold metallo-hydrolase [Clostridium sp. D33t1_170424_F3]|uniref:MBL fold metallo-hydrolase n=1 Tax=Clostridium sp. D33t1_170424_F3 TaxID=2787099 RepID=UPI0018A8CEBA|nr:MBL fold metallo-hydrolase [Clostridium sp. D33t1_170424_F3]
MEPVSIWYLYNSGFAVKTERHFLIFDYFLDSPRSGGLKSGVVDSTELQDYDTVVFVSHSHADHFNRNIFQWRKQIPSIRYVLSDDITTSEECLRVGAGQSCDLGDLQIQTLASTDLGVAFLVQVDGLCIYHAGDLNWWHWNDEPEEANRLMAQSFQKQIDTLEGIPIDIAFLPVDPRQEENALLGLQYFTQHADAKTIIPMHFGSQFSIFDRIFSDPQTLPYRDRIIRFSQRGEIWPHHP